MRPIKRPSSIRWFEFSSVASLAIGLFHQLSVAREGLTTAAITAAMILALTLLVSRFRQGWGRWLFAIMTIFGIGILMINAERVLSEGYLFLTIAVTLIQILATAFLFTRTSSAWFTKNEIGDLR